MSHQIFPGEVLVTEFGAVIRTKCPKDSITDEMIYKRVLNANLAAGDFVRVQCMNHERTTVLHFAEWLVFDRQTQMKRIEVDDRVSRQFEDVTFGVFRSRDWQATPAAAEATCFEPGVTGRDDVPAIEQPAMIAKWNLGKKGYDILLGEEVVGFHVDKDTAQKMAAGEIPLSDAA